MARLKKSAKKLASKKAAPKQDAQAKLAQMQHNLMGSAQQIWAAGMGAFQRAQGEGSKLFEALVKEGMSIEQNTRKLATGKVDAVRDAMEDKVTVARERAADTWDRLEKVFEDRVQRALTRLGVPGREELMALTSRVEALTGTVKKEAGKALGLTEKTVRKQKKVAVKQVKAVKKAAKPAAKKQAAKAKKAKARLPKINKPQAPQN
jgi:poly(hydroxyalkanoate) granule-associated protein